MTPNLLVENAELSRRSANEVLLPEVRSSLGQYMTPSPIAQFMASLFERLPESEVRLLDPGAGVGSLTATVVQEFVKRGGATKIDLTAYELDRVMVSYLTETLEEANTLCEKRSIPSSFGIRQDDFIQAGVALLTQRQQLFSSEGVSLFTHAIINPPYAKIKSSSLHRSLLRSVGIEATNLYAAFVTLAIHLLQPGGELVAIIPRSFCNGPYFRPFRRFLLQQTAIRRIHIFEARDHAFQDDQVLQENIIIHLKKGAPADHVCISTSNNADFQMDDVSEGLVVEDLAERVVPMDQVVHPADSEQFIHVAASGLDQLVVDRMAAFRSSLSNLGLEVSTGPVVDFRMKGDLLDVYRPDAAPLLYPHHFVDQALAWPKEGKKPNAIQLSDQSRRWLWPNAGYYVVTKRFSSKEEKKRIVATVYDSASISADWVGFENHVNVFHQSKQGLTRELAYGLACYLNSSLADRYFRQFNGHTQVNATDLRAFRYPDVDTLTHIGRQVAETNLSQIQTDQTINQIRLAMNETAGSDDSEIDPIEAEQKIAEALTIIKSLGLPKGQHNQRSALTLLALLNLKPGERWTDVERPEIGITPIMEFCREHYGKPYAPNTRETFRRQSMHQFVKAAIAKYNPDDPARPVNSPHACYQISPAAYDVIITFGTDIWGEALAKFKQEQGTLSKQYAKERQMEMIPVTVADGKTIKLTPGDHSQLIRDIIEEFGPRFAPGSEVIYVGDTGEKVGYFLPDRLQELGVNVDQHGKMPDVVLYFAKKNWLLLIESVTSHGPVDSKRHEELAELFAQAKPGLVYVTAFPTRKLMSSYLSEISWETEVWVAEAPTHMVHFNGERFLGPYGK